LSEGRQIDLVVDLARGVADCQQRHPPHFRRIVEHQEVFQGAVVFYPGEAAQLARIPVARCIHEDHGLFLEGVRELLMASKHLVHDAAARPGSVGADRYDHQYCEQQDKGVVPRGTVPFHHSGCAALRCHCLAGGHLPKINDWGLRSR